MACSSSNHDANTNDSSSAHVRRRGRALHRGTTCVLAVFLSFALTLGLVPTQGIEVVLPAYAQEADASGDEGSDELALHGQAKEKGTADGNASEAGNKGTPDATGAPDADTKGDASPASAPDADASEAGNKGTPDATGAPDADATGALDADAKGDASPASEPAGDTSSADDDPELKPQAENSPTETVTEAISPRKNNATWTNNYNIEANGQIQANKSQFTLDGSIINNNTTWRFGLLVNKGNYRLDLKSVVLNSKNAKGALRVDEGAIAVLSNTTFDGKGVDCASGDPIIWLNGSNARVELQTGTVLQQYKNARIVSEGGQLSVAEGNAAEIKDSTLAIQQSAKPFALNKNSKLTITKSTISPTGKYGFEVGDGATLTLNESTLQVATSGDAAGVPAVTVKAGGILVIGKSVVAAAGSDDRSKPAIVVEEGGTLIIEDSNLSGVKASTANGAIAKATNATVEVRRSTFSNNTSAQGGAIRAEGGTIALEDCTFEGNTAGTHGGALCAIGSEVAVWGGKFVNNVATANDGGALCVTRGSLDVMEGTEFRGNKAASAWGGAICANESSLLTAGSVTFSENTASWGGAICVPSTESDASIVIGDGAVFTGNAATHGGAMRVMAGTLLVGAASFDGNSASQNGSGGALDLRIESARIYDGATFTNNYGGNHGGAIAAYETDLVVGGETLNPGGNPDDPDLGPQSIEGVLFEANSANQGGAIYAINDVVTITNTAFTGNDGAYRGGAINGYGTELTLHDTSFEANKASYVGPYGDNQDLTFGLGAGGAVAIAPDVSQGEILRAASLDLKNSTFNNNSASMMGGALAIGHNSTSNTPGEGVTATIEGTTFTNNKVENSYMGIVGGAMYVHNDAYVRMAPTAITSNSADSAGGGIVDCPEGTTYVRAKDGAAIFNNTAGNAAVAGYEDIYFQNRDNADELFERMFNGGLHRWKTSVDVDPVIAEGVEYPGFVAGSDPTNTDVSGASNVFSENSVTEAKNAEDLSTAIYGESIKHPYGYASGGAIGNNGVVEIGRLGEIKLFKVWDDAADKDGYRPTLEQYKSAILDGKLTLLANGEAVDLSSQDITVEVVAMDEISHANNEAEDEGDEAAIAALDAANTYVIVISGLPLVGDDGETPIAYTVEGDDIDHYTSSVSGRIITNKHELDKLTPANVPVEATKVLVGRELVAGEFSFELVDGSGEVVQTKTNDADGAVTFDDLTFSEAGTFAYTVREVAGTDDTVTYDASVYEVSVVVSEGAKAYQAETSITRSGAPA